MQIATKFGPMAIQDSLVPVLDNQKACADLTTGEILFGALAYCSGMSLSEDAMYIAIEAVAIKNPILGQRFGGPHHGRIHDSVEQILQWARMGNLIYDTTWTPMPCLHVQPDLARAHLSILSENPGFQECREVITSLRNLFVSVHWEIIIACREQQLAYMKQHTQIDPKPNA